MKKEVYLRDVKVSGDKSSFSKVDIAAGFIVGHTNEATPGLVFEMVGEPKFDDAVDDMMSAVYHMCAIALIANENKPEVKEEIYKRVVQAFSLVMDKFHPEAKDRRTDIMTDEELKKLEELVKDKK